MGKVVGAGRHPLKNYGRLEVFPLLPTILASDYKSPPVVVEAAGEKVTAVLTRQRSEEEKRRRHLYGDKGAKFSGGKIPKVDFGGVMGTITGAVTKDILLIEVYEEG